MASPLPPSNQANGSSSVSTSSNLNPSSIPTISLPSNASPNLHSHSHSKSSASSLHRVQRSDTPDTASTIFSEDSDNEEQRAYRRHTENFQLTRGINASEHSLNSAISHINITDDDYDNDGISDTIHESKKDGLFVRMGRRIKEDFRMMGELSSVHKDIQKCLKDEVLHPELGWEGTVRRENSLSEDEKKFRANRRTKIAEKLKVYLGLEEDVHPDDVPCIGLGGSGGGFRAMLGLLGTIAAAKESGEWELITYLAGVSGSCWAIAAYYTFGELNIARTIAHFGRHSKHHPLCSHSIHSVLRSKDGPFHAFGPLSLKHAAGLKTHVMDLYGSFLTCWFWLPSRDEAQQIWGERDQRIKHEWTKWSLTRKWVDDGQEPLGIFTAIRHERPWKNWANSEKPFADSNHKSSEHKKALDAWYQWFEFSCYEVGCDEVTGWIPTWAFGRKFDALKSQQRLPEHSLALILGLATSAPAGPLSAYLGTIERNLPQNFLGNMVHGISSRLAKKWGPEGVQKFQNHHPLHASEVWNFLHNAKKVANEGTDEQVGGLEQTPLIEMIDSGLDNNTPTYVFAHPSRDVDICISFDASSDVQKDVFMERLDQFGEQKGLKFTKRAEQPPRQPEPAPGSLSPESQEIYDKFIDRYAQVFDGVPTHPPEQEGGEAKRSNIGVPQAVRKMTQIYVPLLPNARQPEYDPSGAKFSGSYNLVWSQEQVNTIVKTAKANWFEGRLAFRQVIREAYEERKAARLAGKPRLP